MLDGRGTSVETRHQQVIKNTIAKTNRGLNSNGTDHNVIQFQIIGPQLFGIGTDGKDVSRIHERPVGVGGGDGSEGDVIKVR